MFSDFLVENAEYCWVEVATMVKVLYIVEGHDICCAKASVCGSERCLARYGCLKREP